MRKRNKEKNTTLKHSNLYAIRCHNILIEGEDITVKFQK